MVWEGGRCDTYWNCFSVLALNIDDNTYVIDFEFTDFMGGICIALVLSDGSAAYLVGESTNAENVKLFIYGVFFKCHLFINFLFISI